VVLAASPAAADEPDNKGRWSIFPVIASSPETSLMLGGLVLYHFRLGGSDAAEREDGTAARRSSVGAVAAYTFKNQVVTNVWPNLWLDGETWNIGGGFEGVLFPNTLYAVGADSPEDSEEDFTNRAFSLSAGVTRRVVSSLRAGVHAFGVHSDLRDVEPGGLIDTNQIPGSEGGYAVGVGPQVMWDDRDRDMGSTRGSRLELSATVHDGVLGSDYDYTIFVLDLRHYIALPPRGHVLALQSFTQLSYGDIPFQGMPPLGGDSKLRGFFAGRYKDRHMYGLQTEYRLPLYWKFGGTVFAGLGNVAAKVGDFDLLDPRFAGGVGLRYALNAADGVNIRADWATTNEGDFGFYLSLGEAF
jgi:hypothetical protein